ncbi:MAG: NifB/NifX family molybdenum-iron cluster-binding protein [Candidatus Diapherotrites archaeon]|nr:NifB/NifX family molybdenum-iron cluster-binding protein [Candidatus Diapherotrites archaeon]
MKVAIATEDNEISLHFGRCKKYIIAEVKDGKAKKIKEITPPKHEPGALPELLEKEGINTIIAGGMGPLAIEMFNKMKINVISNATGDVETALDNYAKGKLKKFEEACEDHKRDY